MRTRIILLVLLVCFLLVACGAGAQDVNARSTQVVATFVAQMTATANAAEIDSWLNESDETETPTATDGPFLTATPDPGQQLLAKFRTVTVSKGNLYVRDGIGIPVQITSSGTDHDPIISSDGKKIAFYRGYRGEDNHFAFDDVFVINADGSGETELINDKLLPEIADSGVEFLTFHPKTHDLFFSSWFCNKLACSKSILLVSAESAKLTRLVSVNIPMDQIPNQGIVGSFALSPDGQYLSVPTPKQLDLYKVDGKVVHLGITHAPKYENWIALQYWLPDSSGLIAFYGTKGVYDVWRYTLQENKAKQLSFAPRLRPTEPCDFSISLDRNWILYPKDRSSILPQDNTYLGNLKNAQIKLFTWNENCRVNWSPDSQHFASQTAIGSVDGTPPTAIDGHFIAWIDATHYLASRGKSVLDQQTYLVELGHETSALQINFIWSPVYAVLQ